MKKSILEDQEIEEVVVSLVEMSISENQILAQLGEMKKLLAGVVEYPEFIPNPHVVEALIQISNRIGYIERVTEALVLVTNNTLCAFMPEKGDFPHSRACGISIHPHGIGCHRNCPTCAGRKSVN